MRKIHKKNEEKLSKMGKYFIVLKL